jgi:hypothetical protein
MLRVVCPTLSGPGRNICQWPSPRPHQSKTSMAQVVRDWKLVFHRTADRRKNRCSVHPGELKHLHGPCNHQLEAVFDDMTSITREHLAKRVAACASTQALLLNNRNVGVKVATMSQSGQNVVFYDPCEDSIVNWQRLMSNATVVWLRLMQMFLF